MEEKMRPDLVELHYITIDNKKFDRKSEDEISDIMTKLIEIN